ncbi:MAG: hypothetical protein IJH37_04185 [Clostridia bacterium]|nr:hypothetical protein [Clostridia bacterium]
MNKSQRMWRREQERRRAERKRRLVRRRIVALVVVLAVIAVVIVAVTKACSGGGYKTSSPADSESAGNARQTTETSGGAAGEIPAEPQSAVYTPVHSIDDINQSFFENTAFLGDAVADAINMYGLVPNASFYTSVRLDLDNVYNTAVGYGTVPAADALKSTKFSKIFLSFGSGELGLADPQSFKTRYGELVEKVKTYQPNAQIYVIGIPPSSKTASDAGLYGATIQNITDYNRQIENIAEDNKVFYVDSVMALANSNRYLADGVSHDGVSLNKGCLTDLLWFMVNNSYVPDGETNSSSAENSLPGGDEDTKTAASPTPAATAEPKVTAESEVQQNTAPTPQTTVNVLKDSAQQNNN